MSFPLLRRKGGRMKTKSTSRRRPIWLGLEIIILLGLTLKLLITSFFLVFIQSPENVLSIKPPVAHAEEQNKPASSGAETPPGVVTSPGAVSTGPAGQELLKAKEKSLEEREKRIVEREKAGVLEKSSSAHGRNRGTRKKGPTGQTRNPGPGSKILKSPRARNLVTL